MDNQRNLLLAVLLSGLLILGWTEGMRYFYPEADVAASGAELDTAGLTDASSAPGTVAAADGAGEVQALPQGPVNLSAALADDNRVVIDAPRVAGSINLVGARIDDIVLKDYRETVEEDSGPVRIFAPERTDGQYFAAFGFKTGGQIMPDGAVWQADGARLTPQTPVTLTRSDANDVTYKVRLSIDDQFMITAEQSASNGSENAAIVEPFAFIKRRGYVIPEDVRAVCHDVMRHRIGLTYEAEAENITTVDIITDILNIVEVP